jgi:hypothetical protein
MNGIREIHVPAEAQSAVDAMVDGDEVEAHCLFRENRLTVMSVGRVVRTRDEVRIARLPDLPEAERPQALVWLDEMGERARTDVELARWRVRLLLWLERHEEAAAAMRVCFTLPARAAAYDGRDLPGLWNFFHEAQRDALRAETLRFASTHRAKECHDWMRVFAPAAEWPVDFLFEEIGNTLARHDLDMAGMLRRLVAEKAPADARLDRLDGMFERARAEIAAAALARRMNPLYREAWVLAPETERPAGFHLGAAPEISVPDRVRVALICAEHARDAMPEGGERLQEAIEAVRAHLADPEQAGLTERLGEISRTRDKKGAAGLAGALARGALERIRNPANSRLWVEKVPAHAMAILVRADRPGAARALLEAMDREILARDAARRFAEHATPELAKRVARVAWIGLEKDKAEHFLVELDDGRWALLSKQKNRWTAHAGARDEVLATVPDAHFAAATKAV